MQRDNCDGTNAAEWTLKNTLWTLGTMVVLCVLAIGYLWYPSYQKQQEAKAATVAKVAQAKREAGYKTAIKAAMYGPRRKINMAQIEQGSSGLAAGLVSNPYTQPWRPTGNWAIDTGTADGSGEPSGIVASSGSPNGWDVDLDGTVTVPIGAALGNYQAVFYGDEVSPATTTEWWYYNFEVITGGDPPDPRRNTVIMMD